jgi:hypothetical protein
LLLIGDRQEMQIMRRRRPFVLFALLVATGSASLEGQFAAERDAIRQYHQGASETSSKSITLSESGRLLPGRAAEFRFNELFNYQQQDVVSSLYFFIRDDWFVKYRGPSPNARNRWLGRSSSNS